MCEIQSLSEINIFELIALICFSSLGLRASTEPGMILHFFRRMVESVENQIDEMDEINPEEASIKEQIKYLQLNFAYWFSKPLFMCSTCMASIHTIFWFSILELKFDMKLVLVMLSVAFFNTFFWMIILSMKNFLSKK